MTVFQITNNRKIPSKIFRFIKIQLSNHGFLNNSVFSEYKPVVITSLVLYLDVSQPTHCETVEWGRPDPF